MSGRNEKKHNMRLKGFHIVLFAALMVLCGCQGQGKKDGGQNNDSDYPIVVESSDNDTDADATHQRPDYVPGGKIYPKGSDSDQYDVDDDYGDYDEQDVEDAHPGTKPDDGMFGFDPLDDLDDSYDVERYSEDPYPDEY